MEGVTCVASASSRRRHCGIAGGCVLATAGCSLILDRNSSQCKVDADCDRFGGHPSCQQGVCVPSGLGPEGCFAGTPQTQTRLPQRLLDGGLRAVRQLRAARPVRRRWTRCPTRSMPTNPAIPPLVNPVTAPTVNCSDVAPNRIYMYGTSDFAPMLEGGAAAAVGRHAGLSRHLPQRQLVRRRHLGVRLDQAPHQQPGGGRDAELRLLLRRQRQAAELPPRRGRQHRRHRRVEPVLDDVQHLDGAPTCRARR